MKFTVNASEGFQVKSVETTIDGVKAELKANEAGEYTIPAKQVADTITITTKAKETEPAESSEPEPSAPESDEPESDATEPATEPETQQPTEADDPAQPVEEPEVVISNVEQAFAELMPLSAEGNVTVKVQSTDGAIDGTVVLPLGVITEQSVADAIANAGISGLDGYEYRDVRVNNVSITGIYEYDGQYYVKTAEDPDSQIAGIFIEDPSAITVFYMPAGSVINVSYQVMLDGTLVSGEGVPGAVIVPASVERGSSLSVSFTASDNWHFVDYVMVGQQRAAEQNGIYTVTNVQSGDVTIYLKSDTTSQFDLIFQESSNVKLTYGGRTFESGSSDGKGPQTVKYRTDDSITFELQGYNDWSSNDKVLNKLVLTVNGQQRAVNVPNRQGTSATTTLADGTTVVVESTDRKTGSWEKAWTEQYPSYDVTITAPEGQMLRDDIIVVANCRDRNSKEVWVTELNGVEPLYVASGYIIHDQPEGNGDNRLAAGADEYAQFSYDSQRTQDITFYIRVNNGYKADVAPTIEVVIDGEPKTYTASKCSNYGDEGGYDWKFTITSCTAGSDFRVYVTAQRDEIQYGAKLTGFASGSDQIIERDLAVGDVFTVATEDGSAPTREGYVFQGWQLQGAEGVIDPINNGYPFAFTDEIAEAYVDDAPASDGISYLVFEAIWVDDDLATKAPYNIELTFGDGEPIIITENGVPNAKAFIDPDALENQIKDIPGVPNLENWMPDPNNKYDVVVTTDEVATISIHFVEAVTVTFEPGDEGAAEGQSAVTYKVAKGKKFSDSGEKIPEFIAADGYAFDYWTMEGASGEWTNAEISERVINSDTVFVTHWKQKTDLFSYNLAIPELAQWAGGNAPDGFTQQQDDSRFWVDSTKYVEGDPITVTDKVPVAGEEYEFLGWFDKARGGNAATLRYAGEKLTFPDASTYTLDALWASIKAEEKTVTYNGSPQKIDAAEVIYNNDGYKDEILDDINNIVTVDSIQYSKEEGSGYSTDIPTWTDAGEYVVYVKANLTVGNDTYELTTTTKLIIEKRVVSANGHTEKPYDGTDALTSDVKLDLEKATADGKTGVIAKDEALLTAVIAQGSATYAQADVHQNEDLKPVEGSAVKDVVSLTGDASKNYQLGEVAATGTITANEASIVVHIEGNTGTFIYDGSEHEVTGYEVTSITGVPEGLSYTEDDFTFSGSASVRRTDEGTSDMGLASGQFANANKNFSNVTFNVEDGSITIEAQTIVPDPDPDPDDPDPEYKGVTISEPDDQVYDGTAHEPAIEVKASDGTLLQEGTDYELDYSNNVNATTNDSLAAVTVTGIGNYTGTVVKDFKIAKRPVTFKSESAGKAYDGTALIHEVATDVDDPSNPNDGLVEGETVEYISFASIENVGSVDNSYEVVWADSEGKAGTATAKLSNYDPTYEFGTLHIYKQSIDPDDPDVPDPDDPDVPDYPDPDDPDIPDDPDDPDYPVYYNGVTVNSPSDLPYDGVEHKWAPEVKGKDGQALTEGTDYKVEYFDANGNVKTDFTNVTGEINVVITGQGNYSGTVERTYQITPVELVVTIDNLTKTEGEADPQFGFTTSDGPNVENMVWTGQFERQAGETAGTYAVTGGTFALADSADGSFLAANYNLRVVPGSLTIEAAPVPVTPPTPDPTPDDDTDDGTVPVPTPAPADDGTADDDATAEEGIAEAAVPLAAAAGGVAIADNATPMAAGEHRDCWVHWFMILGIVATAAYAAGVAARRSKFSGDLKNFEDKVLGNGQSNQ